MRHGLPWVVIGILTQKSTDIRIAQATARRQKGAAARSAAFEFGDRGAIAAFGGRGRIVFLNGGVLREGFVHQALEYTHPVAMDDTDAGDFAKEGGIEKAFEFLFGVEGGLADEVQLAGEGVPTWTRASEGDTRGQSRGGTMGGRQYFEDFSNGNLHLEQADFDFEAVRADAPEDPGGLADVAKADPGSWIQLFGSGRGGGLLAAGGGGNRFLEFAFGGGDLAERAFGLFALFGGSKDAFDGGTGFRVETHLGLFDLLIDFSQAGSFAADHLAL